MSGLRGLKALTSSNLTGMAQYFNLPTIGGLYYPRKSLITNKVLSSVLAMLDIFKFGIPIYPDVYEESGGNEISEQVLVGGIGSDSPFSANVGADIAGALIKVADNIVVNPRRWKIHGYTGFNTNTKVGNFLDEIIPESTLQSFITKFGSDTLNVTLKQTLQYISEARRPFKFNTREGETIPCLIKSYNVKFVAENSNFIELDLEIQEFRFLAISGNEKGDIVSAGGITTNALSTAKLGRTALRTLSL